VWDALGLTSATFLGMSFGGYLSIRYASRHPERVEALITLAPAGVSHVQIPRVLWSVLPAIIGEAGGLQAARRLGHGSFDPEMEQMLTLSLGHYIGLPVLRPWLHSDEDLRRLTMPVMLLNGDDDAFFDGHASVSRIRRLVPHSKAEVIPGETHMLNKHFGLIMKKVSTFCAETTPLAIL
jgi:pimeloyl-ACP methyl ester carboxylesterase